MATEKKDGNKQCNAEMEEEWRHKGVVTPLNQMQKFQICLIDSLRKEPRQEVKLFNLRERNLRPLFSPPLRDVVFLSFLIGSSQFCQAPKVSLPLGLFGVRAKREQKERDDHTKKVSVYLR